MTDEKQVVSYEILAKALFEGYESIYAIDLETSEYRVYYESESYHKLELARRGDDFFESLLKTVSRVIAPKDRECLEIGSVRGKRIRLFNGNGFGCGEDD